MMIGPNNDWPHCACFCPKTAIPRITPFTRGMKFATQISPPLN